MLAFGNRIRVSRDLLDTFIANANVGIDTTRFVRIEGHECTLTTKEISTLLAATLVIPKLRVQQKPSHLVFTGSVAHINAK